MRAPCLSRLGMLTAGLAAFGAQAQAQVVELPSGLTPSLSEVLVDQVGDETWLRFRFVAEALDPQADASVEFAAIEGDFALICADLALPYAAKHALQADKIVVSVADRFVEYGKTDPAATQYFEQFRITDGDCIWEGF